MLFSKKNDFMTKEKNELMIELMRNPYSFSYFPEKWRGDKELALEAIRQLPHNYYYLSKDLKKDRIIGLNTILSNGMLFGSLSEDLRRDKEIAFIACESHPFNVKYVSEELKKDKDLFFLLVRKNYWGISYFSEELVNDKDIVEEAMKINVNIFHFLSSSLKFDKKFLIDMIQKFNIKLKDIPEIMRSNTDVIKCAIQKDYKNFIQIPKKIYENDAFIFQLFLLNKKIKIFLRHTRHEGLLDKYHCLLVMKKKQNETKQHIFQDLDICSVILKFF